MKKKVIALTLATVLCLSTSLTALASSTTTDNSGDADTTTTTTTVTGSTLSGDVTDDGIYQSNTSDDSVVANYSNSITNSETVSVVDSDSGEVKATTFTEVINETITNIVLSSTLNVEEIAALTTEVETTVAATGQDKATVTEAATTTKITQKVVEAITTMLTSPATEQFTKTVEAAAKEVAADTNKKMRVNVMGTVRTEGAGAKGATAVDSYGNNIASAGVVSHTQQGQPIMLMSVNEDGTVEVVQAVIDPVTGQVVGLFKGKPRVLTVLVVTYTEDGTATVTVSTSEGYDTSGLTYGTQTQQGQLPEQQAVQQEQPQGQQQPQAQQPQGQQQPQAQQQPQQTGRR
jgi:hypothetical protein